MLVSQNGGTCSMADNVHTSDASKLCLLLVNSFCRSSLCRFSSASLALLAKISSFRCCIDDIVHLLGNRWFLDKTKGDNNHPWTIHRSRKSAYFPFPLPLPRKVIESSVLWSVVRCLLSASQQTLQHWTLHHPPTTPTSTSILLCQSSAARRSPSTSPRVLLVVVARSTSRACDSPNVRNVYHRREREPPCPSAYTATSHSASTLHHRHKLGT